MTRGLLSLVAIAAALVVAGTMTTYARHEFVRLGYDLSSTGQTMRKLEEENRQLRLEIAVLTSPERVERLARGLGMEMPTPAQLKVAPKGGHAD